MSTQSGPSGKTWVVVGISLAVVAAAAWGLSRDRAVSASTLPEHLSADAIKAGTVNRQAVRDAFRDENMTDEQRRELRNNLREARRDMMKERVDAWYDAAQEDKAGVLDKQIDEFVERMKEWEKERKKREAEGEERPDFARMFGNRTQAERKAQSESRNPDQAARRGAYFRAMRGRMTQRGIETPWGGRGSGGSGGRGAGGRRGP